MAFGQTQIPSKAIAEVNTGLDSIQDNTRHRKKCITKQVIMSHCIIYTNVIDGMTSQQLIKVEVSSPG